MFLRNLLLDEKNGLHNRAMHIRGAFFEDVNAESQSAKTDNSKCKNCTLDEAMILKELAKKPNLTQKELA